MGKMGLLHGAILNSLENVEMTSISESLDMVTNVLKLNNPSIKTYKDYKQMLEKEELDTVFLTTPVFLHIPMAIECAKRGISFFIEKPLSVSSHEAEELVDLLENKKITNMVGYMMRYIETFKKAKEIIKSNALGNLIMFNGTIYVSQLFKQGKGWRYEKDKSGGGVLMMQGSHLIDLILWYFGDVESVSGFVRNWYSKETEDFAHCLFKFKSGLTGWMDSSWSVRNHRLVETKIEIHAENGKLIVNDDIVKLFLDSSVNDYRSGWTILKKPDLFKGVKIDIGGGQYTREDEDFINAVSNKSFVESDVLSAFEVQKVIDGVYESDAQNRKLIFIE